MVDLIIMVDLITAFWENSQQLTTVGTTIFKLKKKRGKKKRAGVAAVVVFTPSSSQMPTPSSFDVNASVEVSY